MQYFKFLIYLLFSKVIFLSIYFSKFRKINLLYTNHYDFGDYLFFCVEVRDKLTELDKLIKMNVRLKNEIGVDSTSYWKRTHGAMKKISERLVKLANKIGQLY